MILTGKERQQTVPQVSPIYLQARKMQGWRVWQNNEKDIVELLKGYGRGWSCRRNSSILIALLISDH
jgi:hypothetical protein